MGGLACRELVPACCGWIAVFTPQSAFRFRPIPLRPRFPSCSAYALFA
jgi:hypothetical protein